MIPCKMIVTRDDQPVGELSAECIPLEYPELAGRAEVCMGRTRSEEIYAAVGATCGAGGANIRVIQRLFHSSDSGYTWRSWPIEFPDDAPMTAFTVLMDDSFLRAVVADESRRIHFYRSTDQGRTWQIISEIPAEPFERIGEGFLSLTQLRDEMLLFPVCRWNVAPEGQPNEFPHYVFRSIDGGESWQGGGGLHEAAITVVGEGPASRWLGMGGTFPGCCETHIVELASGQLLAAFRYSGYPQPWHQGKVSTWGGRPVPDGIGRFFKHVFVGDSMDGGQTWHNLRPLLDADGRPVLVFGECHGQLAQVPDGRVVLVHDRRYPYDKAEIIGRISEDGGRTWLRAAYHLSDGSGYPASVVLEDGTIITVTGNTRLDPQSHPIEPWSVQAIRWRLE